VLREPEPLGTAGALTRAGDGLDEQFILMNGDALFDINLRAFELAAQKGKTAATIALRFVEDASRYGRVVTSGTRVTRFVEKDASFCGPAIINGGVYVLSRDILRLVTRLPCSLETDIFPHLATQGMIEGVVLDGYFIDIGVPEALERAHRELPLVRSHW
jgi:D-glycero-D-manno-heptose 1,7-bisphosphate phosphatase